MSDKSPQFAHIRPHLASREPSGRGRSGSRLQWKCAEIPSRAHWYYLEAIEDLGKPASRRSYIFASFRDLLDLLGHKRAHPEFVLMYVPQDKAGFRARTLVEIEAAYAIPNSEGFLFVSTEQQIISDSEVTVLEKHATELKCVYPLS